MTLSEKDEAELERRLHAMDEDIEHLMVSVHGLREQVKRLQEWAGKTEEWTKVVDELVEELSG